MGGSDGEGGERKDTLAISTVIFKLRYAQTSCPRGVCGVCA